MKKNRLPALIIVFALVLGLCSGCVTQTKRNPTATIKFSTGHEITIRLYYGKAPNTVKNFISLARSGFYDGLSVHRVVKYSFIQMGDPNGDGTGNAGYYIEGEFPNNGFKKNDLSHTERMVSMARLGNANNDSDYYDKGSSQFFILTGNKTELDGDYAVFGEVIRGYDEFAKLDQADVDENKMPLDEIIIESVTIETYGETYGEPKTLPLDD